MVDAPPQSPTSPQSGGAHARARDEYFPSAAHDLTRWPSQPEATSFGGTFAAADVGGSGIADEMNAELRSFVYRHTLTLCVAGIFAFGNLIFLATRMAGGGVSIQLEYVNMVGTPAILLVVFIAECLLHFRSDAPTPPSSRVRQAAAVVTVATFGLTFVRHAYNVHTCVPVSQWRDEPNATLRAGHLADRQEHCIDVIDPFVVVALATGMGVVHVYPTAVAPIVLWIIGNYYIGRLLVDRDEDPESTMTFGLTMAALVVIAGIVAGISWIRHHAAVRAFLASVELHRVSALQRREQDHVDQLLATTLPDSVLTRVADAVALGGAPEIDDDESAAATVLYADICDFTRWSAARPASEVVEMLQVLVCAFDGHAAALNVEKVKTIGDCYWAVSGIPEPNAMHADAVTYLGLCLVATTEAANTAHPRWGGQLALRVGCHSGPVSGILLGSDRLAYEPYGPTCRVAQAAEAAGAPNRVCVTGATWRALKETGGPLARLVDTKRAHGSVDGAAVGGENAQLFLVARPTAAATANALTGGRHSMRTGMKALSADAEQHGNTSEGEEGDAADGASPPNVEREGANAIAAGLPVDTLGDASVISVPDLNESSTDTRSDAPNQPTTPLRRGSRLAASLSSNAGLPEALVRLAPTNSRSLLRHSMLASTGTGTSSTNTVPGGDDRLSAVQGRSLSGESQMSAAERDERRQRRLLFAEQRMAQSRRKQREIEKTAATTTAAADDAVGRAKYTLSNNDNNDNADANANASTTRPDEALDEAAEAAKLARRYPSACPGMMAFAGDAADDDYHLFAMEQTRGLRLYTRGCAIGLLVAIFILQAAEGSKIAIALYAVTGLAALVALGLTIFDLAPWLEHSVAHVYALLFVLTLAFTDYSVVANSNAWAPPVLLLLVSSSTPRFPSLLRSVLYVVLCLVAAVFAITAPVTANALTVLVLGAVFGCLMLTAAEAQLRLEYRERVSAQRAGVKIFEAKEQQVALLASMVPMHVIPALVTWTNGGMDPAKAIASSYDEVAIAFVHFTPPKFAGAHVRGEPNAAGAWLRSLHQVVDAALSKCVAAEKMKSIGDVVLAAGPFTRAPLAFDATCAAVADVLYLAHALMASEASRDGTGITCGAHVGPVMAAVLGTSRLCFDIFGDAVNTTSRVLSGLERNLGNATSGAAVSATVLGLLKRHDLLTGDGGGDGGSSSPPVEAQFPSVHRRPALNVSVVGPAIATEAKGKGTLMLHRVRSKVAL